MRTAKQSHRARRGSDRTDGVTIVSGAAIPVIDLDLLLRPGGGEWTVAGGARQTEPVRTVALTDGTRITFAAAPDFAAMEPV